MKFLPSQLMFFVQAQGARRNLRVLARFLAVLAIMITAYSVIFHYIMELEGRQHSWMTGFYWTLTVMSTLGFGDITFETDIGRLFSTIVLLSGIVFLLVLLPFTIIQFFYAPWMEAQAAARTPKAAPDLNGHVILTSDDAASMALIRKLRQFSLEYILIVPDSHEAIRLHDEGLQVVVGDFDDPQTYERVRAADAALVATTRNDFVNTHVVFTVRGVAPDVPIIATASSAASVDILARAGATEVLRLGEQMGQALARFVSGGDAVTHVVATIDEVVIAEANAAKTPLVGKTLRENRLREIGVTVLGIWDRGHFEPALADSVVGPSSILLLTGTAQQLEAYDEEFVIYNVSTNPILILGGGRVGRAAARALSTRDIDWRIVETETGRVSDESRTIIGDAADLEVLQRAGIERAPAVLITTRNDDLNIYLTIYCRSLRPDIQIISRVTGERNVPAMHRAGADFVLSYASMGATSMFNLIRRSSVMSIAEGLDVFRLPVPRSLGDQTILESRIREQTGCTIVAVRGDDGMQINPPPGTRLVEGHEMVLVGSPDAEKIFLEQFVDRTSQ